MRELSVFDVIGPIMTGPSSSHTAGACRLALVAAKIAGGTVLDVHFKLFGSFSKTYKGHGTDRALVAGALGMNPDDENIKNSFDIAKERGLIYSFEIDDGECEYHPNTVEITIKSSKGTTTFVRGSSIGGGEIVITNVNGTEINFSGKYNAILVRQLDEPGVLASITNLLCKYKLNIAFMTEYRENKGEKAFTVIEIDGDVEHKLIEEIRELPNVLRAKYCHIVDGGAQ